MNGLQIRTTSLWRTISPSTSTKLTLHPHQIYKFIRSPILLCCRLCITTRPEARTTVPLCSATTGHAGRTPPRVTDQSDPSGHPAGRPGFPTGDLPPWEWRRGGRTRARGDRGVASGPGRPAVEASPGR